MAARWGSRARKRSIGSMDLFTGASPLQCHALEEDGNYSGMSDLGLSSFDTSELLGTFRGYLDPTIISIIEGAGSQCESKSRFDEENELSLLTALTEILDNADDENLSPFDSIPDNELLVSQRDRDSSLQRFLNLSRSPPDHSILTVDEHKMFKSNGSSAAFGKVESRAEDSWDMFPDCLSSTPVRHNKVKSTRKGVQKVRDVPVQLSDGEEKVYSPEHDTSSESSIDYVDFGLDFINELSTVSTIRPEEPKSKHGTPHIINTANVSLGDLVKYMHSYCIPSRTVCVEPVNTELGEDFLSNGIVLEIDDCFSPPVLVQDSRPEFPDKNSVKIICPVEQVDSKITTVIEKECQMLDDARIQERAEQSKEAALQSEHGMKAAEQDGDEKSTLQSEIGMLKSVKNAQLQNEFGMEESADVKKLSLNGESGIANQTLELNESIPALQLEHKDQADHYLDALLDATQKNESEGDPQAYVKCAELEGQADELEKAADRASVQDSEMVETEPNSVVDKCSPNSDCEKDENIPAENTDTAGPDMHSFVQTVSELEACAQHPKNIPSTLVKCEASELKLKDLAPMENSESKDGLVKHSMEPEQSDAEAKHSLEMEQNVLLQDSSTENQTVGVQELCILQVENDNGFRNLPDSLEKLPENVETTADCTLTGKRKCNLRKHSTKMLNKSQKKKELQNVKQGIVPPKCSPIAQLQDAASDENKLPKVGPHQASSLSNPSLKESDLLIKKLEQAKKESQMEQKLLKASRAMKSRARSNPENSSGVSSLDKKVSPMKGRDPGLSPKVEKEGIPPTLVDSNTLEPSVQTLGSKEPFVEHTLTNTEIEASNISLGAKRNSTPDLPDGHVKCDSDAAPVSNETSEAEGEKNTSVEVEREDSASVEEEAYQNNTKDIKPKCLSLKEYRMRMQQRKAKTDDKKEHENLTNKWPSLPEPPTELAEIPCLMKPKIPSLSKITLPKIKPYQEPNVLESPESPVLESSGDALTEVPPAEDHNNQTPPSFLQHSQSIESSPTAGVPQSTQPPCALYTEPPPALWPLIPSQTVGYPFPPPLPPPPVPCISSNAFHAVPIPPAPMLSWPPPFPPPPIGSGPFHTYPPGWGACLPPPLPPPPLPPSYWPSVPLPPTIPPLMYCDRGPPVQGSSGVPFPPSVPSAPMQRVEFPSTNLNPPLLQSVEQKTPVISYQELPDVLQNVQNIATRPNGQTADLHKPADHVKSAISLVALDQGKTESTASAHSSSDKIKTLVKKTGKQVFSSETPAKQTTVQKMHPAECEVSATTASQTLPNNQQNIRGEVVKQMIPQSTNELVLKIFELLRKAQQTSSSQEKIVSDTPKPQIDTKLPSVPLAVSPALQTSHLVLQTSDGFRASVPCMPLRPNSVQECVESKPVKQSSDEAVTSMTLKPQEPHQTIGTMPLKTMDVQESALPVMQKQSSVSLVPSDTLQPFFPMADSKPQNVVPLVVQKCQGVVQDLLPVQKPQFVLPNPLAVQKPQGVVQQPLAVETPQGVVQTPSSVQKPQGMALSGVSKLPSTVQRPQDVDPGHSPVHKPQGALPVHKHEGVVPVSLQKPQVAAWSPLAMQKPQAMISVASAAQNPDLVGPSAQKLQAVGLATQISRAAPLLIPSVYEKRKMRSSRDTTKKRGVIGKEKVIEASDLTSLLEQFEESEAKEEKHCSQSPGENLAVGNSRFETGVEKTSLDTLLAPGFGSTAELTPPATPPHQPLSSVTHLGKPSIVNATLQEGTGSSPLKTVKLIEAKPLPQSKLRKRNSVIDACQTPAVHVGYGEHDYCFLSTSQPENHLDATQLKTGLTSLHSVSASEGSRWNVKHHQSIVIKPISSITKRSQNKDCPVQDKGSEKSIPCSPNKSLMYNDSVPTKDCKAQLDHRTSVANDANVNCSTTSVLMSPEASPHNSDGGELRTKDRRGNAAASKRSLRCYRKHKDSASLQSSVWQRQRTHTSRSCSSSCSSSDSEDSSSFSSSSSSRSRSRSAPPKKRRRYKSRNSQKSRSSSRSSCGSCGRSRGRSSSASTTYSSRSYSTSYSRSRSRSRSRSPYSRRYEYYDNRANYRRRRVSQQERAIEERRVVYIGKIPGVMTRAELKHRFSVFGTIEECNIHFRDHGDNYGFVTYRYTEDAFTAIENGHKLRRPDELPFDLCFGGRRQFCKSNYADLDSNRGDYDPMKNKFESLDFDTLLKQAQKSIRR
ncbi:peroxisome proliferator-activated receptor gamma coactivator-related protein 1 [Pleurodeles waltl]